MTTFIDLLEIAIINAIGYTFGTLIANLIHDKLIKKPYKHIKKILKKRKK